MHFTKWQVLSLLSLLRSVMEVNTLGYLNSPCFTDDGPLLCQQISPTRQGRTCCDAQKCPHDWQRELLNGPTRCQNDNREIQRSVSTQCLAGYAIDFIVGHVVALEYVDLCSLICRHCRARWRSVVRRGERDILRGAELQ